MKFEIIFYTLTNGIKPVAGFIKSLPPKMQVKSMDALRIKFVSDISRIFYFFIDGRKIILTNGYLKKSSKTDGLELKKALAYKKDYEERMRNERN